MLSSIARSQITRAYLIWPYFDRHLTRAYLHFSVRTNFFTPQRVGFLLKRNLAYLVQDALRPYKTVFVLVILLSSHPRSQITRAYLIWPCFGGIFAVRTYLT